MTAKECVGFVVSLVNDREMEKILEKLDAGETLSNDEKKLEKRYISGLNIAVDTISSRYYSCEKEVRVVSDNEQKILYEALSPRVYEVLSVKEASGQDVDFYTLPFSVYVPKIKHEYKVKFKYLPQKVDSLADEVNILPFVPVRAVAYLMASDLLLTKNLYDEARFWFNNFESVMNQVVAKRRVRTLNISRLI